MRSRAITALAALSLISGTAAAVVARESEIIVDFSAYRDAHCNDPRGDFLYLTLITDRTIDNFKNGPTCIPFHNETGGPTDIGAAYVSQLRDGCELDVYPDAACQESPARPEWAQCVWNAAERFRAWSIRCNGELLW